jgi:hypothetical protein
MIKGANAAMPSPTSTIAGIQTIDDSNHIPP